MRRFSARLLSLFGEAPSSFNESPRAITMVDWTSPAEIIHEGGPFQLSLTSIAPADISLNRRT